MNLQNGRSTEDNRIIDQDRLAMSSSMDIGGGIAALGQIVLPAGFSGRRTRLADKHEIDIAYLRQRLENKEAELANLRQQLKEISERNYNLEIKLKTKDKEVEQLKDRIQQLEEEKKDLQDELAKVETKLKRLEIDVKTLTKSSRSHEEENQRLKEDLQKVEYSLKTTEEKLTSENEKLAKEVKHLKETRAIPMLEQPQIPLQPSFENAALLQFGELCWQIQGALYKKVLPKYYTPVRSYKVKYIEKDVKKLLKSDQERDEANRKWTLLKSKLNWSEDIEETIRSLQDSRNVQAHPYINASSLEHCATILEDHGILKGWMSLHRVKELISIWKRLSDGTDITEV